MERLAVYSNTLYIVYRRWLFLVFFSPCSLLTLRQQQLDKTSHAIVIDLLKIIIDKGMG